MEKLHEIFSDNIDKLRGKKLDSETANVIKEKFAGIVFAGEWIDLLIQYPLMSHSFEVAEEDDLAVGLATGCSGSHPADGELIERFRDDRDRFDRLLEVTRRDNGELAFSYRGSELTANAVLEAVRQAGIVIKDVRTEQANLEDVFLALTRSR